MFKLQFKSSERPEVHGGPIIYPMFALPLFPFNEDGDFSSLNIENNFYDYYDEYIAKIILYMKNGN